MSGGFQSCAHCKGLSLRVTYRVLVSTMEKFRKVHVRSCIQQLISQVILATVVCLNEVRLSCDKQLWQSTLVPIIIVNVHSCHTYTMRISELFEH